MIELGWFLLAASATALGGLLSIYTFIWLVAYLMYHHGKEGKQ